MAGIVHGKIEVLSTRSDGALGNIGFKAIFDLLNSRTGSGEVTRIAFNNGSGGNGEGYFDEVNSLGQNAFACYQMHSNSNRNFDWYVLIQFVSHSTTFGNPPGNPAAIGGNASFGGGTDDIGIGIAAAVTVSGSSTGNPWNGTSNNDGNDSKGDPVWQSASSDHDLYVLPRSNNSDGAHSTSKENMMEFFTESSTVDSARIHVLLDDEALVTAFDYQNDQTYALGYIGSYEGKPTITSSVPITFCAFFRDAEGTGDLFDTTDVAGSKTGDGFWEGGIVTHRGVKRMSIRRYENDFLNNTSMQPNKQFSPPHHDKFPVALVCTETGEEGHMGFLTRQMYTEAYNISASSNTSNLENIVLGDNTSLATIKAFVPWDGNTTLESGNSFTGSLF